MTCLLFLLQSVMVAGFSTADIRSAVQAAGDGGVVEFPAGQYDVTGTIRPRSGQTFVGYRAVLRRADSVTTLLTSDVRAGDHTITAADASIYAPGMYLSIVESSGLMRETDRHQIVSVEGNQITLRSSR